MSRALTTLDAVLSSNNLGHQKVWWPSFDLMPSPRRFPTTMVVTIWAAEKKKATKLGSL